MSLETGAHQCDKALVTSYKGAFKADNHGTQTLPPPSITQHHHTGILITSNTCTT